MVVGVIIDNFQKCRILVEEEIGMNDNNNQQRSESGMNYFENCSLTIKLITRNKKVFEIRNIKVREFRRKSLFTFPLILS